MKNNKNELNFPRKKVYFEKQSDDRLCGLHCLNNLLQGPFFDLVMLSQIGLELDKEEFELTGIHSQNNVDDSGNYNIQVLEHALKLYGAEIKNLKGGEAVKILNNNGQFSALIFNSSTHWFAIRKIDNIWFNLNSTNSSPGPEIISDFYLDAFIQGTEELGFTNFMVTNLPNLPELYSEQFAHLASYQHLVDFEDILKSKDLKIKQQKERDDKRKKEEENKKNAFTPFTGQGYMVDDGYQQYPIDYMDNQYKYNNNNQYGFNNNFYSDFFNGGNNMGNSGFNDDEMKLAMQLSLDEFKERTLRELPKEPTTGGYEITIKYENKFFVRKFNDNDTIQTVIKYAQSQIPTMAPLELFEPFPKLVLSDVNKKLCETTIARNQFLMVKVLK